MHELSSYSQDVAVDQREPPPSPTEDGIGNLVEPTPEAAPAASDASGVEEDNPLNASLEPAPTNASPTEPESTEPDPTEPEPTEPEPTASEPTEPATTEPVSTGTAPDLTPPAVDAAECAAMGGSTIAATSSCYLVGDTTFSWQDARDVCDAWGGDLVEIGSAEENAELAQLVDGSAWIGAIDPDEDGIFLWAGGDPLDYTGWADGQPNNLDGLEHCVELRAFDDQWSDVPCVDDFARQAFCERPSSM